jgi:signal peptidase I
VVIYNETNPDGVALEETYLDEGVKTYSMTEDTINLEENEYYVLGDNRNSSKDSRSFGPVNRSFITGRVILRGWPLSRINLFESPVYNYEQLITQ